MRKCLVIKKIALIMIVASLLMPLSSCHGNRKRLSSNEESSFLITYSQKEIVIESIKKGVVEHFFYKNGEYFASSDSILFFSTVKDTILNVTSYDNKYKIIIKKEKDGVYKTSSYYVNDMGCLYFLISYSYDSKYQIFQIEKCKNVVYQ
ncbi:hypothetical protein [Segatella copri]|jgi:hypothetical protein|uniref:Lipoprotein n=1 Tax=Segatella copri TaxID=165179 RepID=A0AA90ZMZ6_9BACT|nr:hypothetical protein [Segatella copri]MQN69071.1 hypothetical protein [Segatella copri]MQN77932.1 hypothetical protein [Segatella copri]MQO00049.1 hypothetical protein [Segatella copri]